MSKKFGLGLLLGAVAGVVGGILTAPKSGKETREDLAKKSKEVGEALKHKTEETIEKVDEVAERILALGGNPVSSMKEAMAIATIKELENGPKSTDAVIHALVSDTDYWIKDSKEIVELAEKEGDGVTADMFNGYTKEYQKLAWMLKSYQS